jgi:hypothetical protein
MTFGTSGATRISGRPSKSLTMSETSGDIEGRRRHPGREGHPERQGLPGGTFGFVETDVFTSTKVGAGVIGRAPDAITVQRCRRQRHRSDDGVARRGRKRRFRDFRLSNSAGPA